MSTTTVTAESIRELMDTAGPCLTLVSKPGQELIQALNVLRRDIEAYGASAQELSERVLGAVNELPNVPDTANRIAVFCSPATLLVSHVGPDLSPIAKVAEKFDLRTMLAVAGVQRRFFILALSQNRTRLLACTQDHSEEIPLPQGVPTSYADDRQTRQPDHRLDNMSVGGPSTGSMKGVMSGTSTDREDKDRYMLHFLTEVHKGVHAVIKDSKDPLILVGVEHEIAMYTRVNTYAGLVGPGVHGSPDGLEGGEIHKRALEILRTNPHDPAVALLQEFDKKVGTGHGSTHVQEIVTAAYEGRVSHLYFQENAQYQGTFDAVRQRVRHNGAAESGGTDLIESAAVQTLAHGGEVRLLRGSEMPNGLSVCAIFRYPAVKPSSENTEAA